jgi:hypothetical protein
MHNLYYSINNLTWASVDTMAIPRASLDRTIVSSTQVHVIVSPTLTRLRSPRCPQPSTPHPNDARREEPPPHDRKETDGIHSCRAGPGKQSSRSLPAPFVLESTRKPFGSSPPPQRDTHGPWRRRPAPPTEEGTHAAHPGSLGGDDKSRAMW